MENFILKIQKPDIKMLIYKVDNIPVILPQGQGQTRSQTTDEKEYIPV